MECSKKKKVLFTENPFNIRLYFSDAKIAYYRQENAVESPERSREILRISVIAHPVRTQTPDGATRRRAICAR